MSTDGASGVLSDGFFILPNSVKMDKEKDGTLGGTQVPIGLSKVPNLHDPISESIVLNQQEGEVREHNLPQKIDYKSIVSNDYGIEKRQLAYNPEFKDDARDFTFYEGARYCEIRQYKYDTREYEATGYKIPVQKKSKIGDDDGRLGRHITEFSRRQQKHMRRELCKLNVLSMPYSPLWIDLTTTTYVYKLRESGKTNAVSNFCKDGLLRFKERLRRHDQYRHLTGMYKWEFTISELPHLHLLAWFDKWTGDPNLKEHQFIDLDWFALNWYESLFPTKELQEENQKHLEAGTRVEKVRGYSKRHAKRKMIKKVEAYSKDKFEQDREEIDPKLDDDGKLKGMSERDFTEALKLEGKGGAWEKAGNYLTKYITKEYQDVPLGWGNSRFHGVINRNAFKSYQKKVVIKNLKPEEREAIHTAMVQIENETIVNHVRLSKNLKYLIKKEEQRVYVREDDEGFYTRLYLEGTDDLLHEQDDYRFRTFHHKWEWDPTTINEDGTPKKHHWGFEIKPKRMYKMIVYEDEELLDENGDPKKYVKEFFEHVYDADYNYIGIYEQAKPIEVKVMETEELTHDFTWEDDDGQMQTTREWKDLDDHFKYTYEEGIDVHGCITKDQFILTNKHGEVLEIHENWKDIKGRQIRNEDEYRYVNVKSMYGVDYQEILTRAFPNHSFTIEDYRVTKTSIDKNNNYFKEEIELCLNIKPLITVEQENQVMQLQAS